MCSTPTCSSPTVADLSNSSSIPTPNDFSLLSHGSHMSEQSYLDASPLNLLSDHDVLVDQDELVAADVSQEEALSWTGFTLVGDNIDKRVNPRQMREDHQSRVLNYFFFYAVRDRIDLSSLSDQQPVFDPALVCYDKFLPSASEICQLKKNIAILVGRMLCKHQAFFQLFDDAITPHINHKYSKEMAKTSEVVS